MTINNGYEFPFVELDNKIVIWRPAKIIILKD